MSVSVVLTNVAVCVLLFVSLCGWGRETVRLVIGNTTWCRFLRPAVGLAVNVLLGGVLNIAGAVSPVSVRLCVLVGILLNAPDFAVVFRDRRTYGEKIRRGLRDHFLVAEIVGLVLLVVFQVWACTGRQLNARDDFQAYLVYPVKMLQTGSIGVDPFNARRMYSSLGGHYFLESQYLGFSDIASLYCVELGVGWWCLLAVILGYGLHRGASPRAVLGLGILLHAAVFGVCNTTSTITGAVTVGALLAVIADREPASSVRRGILLGFLAAGSASLKMCYVPTAGSILLVGQFVCGNRALTKRIQETLVAGICTVLLLLPWMVDSYRNCGSLMFPFLGTGNLGAVCGERHLPGMATESLGVIVVVREIWRIPLLWIGMGLSVLGVVRFERVGPVSRVILSGLWVAWFMTVAIAWASGGVTRFGIPVLVITTWLLAAECLVASPDCRPCWRKVATLGLVALYAGSLTFLEQYSLLLSNWKPVLGPPGSSLGILGQHGLFVANWRCIRYPCREFAEQVGTTQEIQRAVPAGASILARLARPYALNFRRNPIYVVDFAGVVSPRPGMPVYGTPEDLATYLRRVGIRYVAYSYADAAAYRRPSGSVARPGSMKIWKAVVMERAFLFNDQLDALGRQYSRLVDNGYAFVLDLGR